MRLETTSLETRKRKIEPERQEEKTESPIQDEMPVGATVSKVLKSADYNVFHYEFIWDQESSFCKNTFVTSFPA